MKTTGKLILALIFASIVLTIGILLVTLTAFVATGSALIVVGGAGAVLILIGTVIEFTS